MGRIYCLNIFMQSILEGGDVLIHSPKAMKKLSEQDLAHEILATQGRPMYYQDLIREVLERQNRPLEPNAISSTLTQINLDARFVYVNNGEWGLKVWVPTKSSRRTPTIALLNKELNPNDEQDNKDMELEEKELFSDDD